VQTPTTQTWPLVVLLLAVTWVTAGCKTRVKVDDTTPPTAELRYRFDDDEWTLMPTAGLELELEESETMVGRELHLWAIGRDSGGVESIKIVGLGSMVCERSDGLRSTHEVSVRAKHSEEGGLEEGDSTEAVRNVVLDFSFCPSEEKFRSGWVSFTAHAVNFAGGTGDSGALEVGRDKVGE